MAAFSRTIIERQFRISDAADSTTAKGRNEKGKALEELIVYIFSKVPGIIMTESNVDNVQNSEEIDVAFWNDQKPNALKFLPQVIIVECKNWAAPVGSNEVTFFDAKVKRKGLKFGIIVAASGITGNTDVLNAANHVVALAMADGRDIIVLTRADIEGLRTTQELVLLLKQKILNLKLKGSI